MSAKLRPVPVSMGSPRFRTVELGGLALTQAWFPPATYLHPHIHDRACFAVMLEGSFDVTFRTAAYDCRPTSVHIEPLGERHANRIGRAGAHVIVVQPDPTREQLVRSLAPLLTRVTQRQHAGVAELASHLALELEAQDGAAPLAQEGLALEMLALAARIETTWQTASVPAWLLRAQEYLHAHRLDSLRVTDIAAQLGVDPTRLARAFRRHFHAPLGAYLRRLRLEWAAAQLDRADETLAAIALRAGFADQSHFTRAFTRYAGIPPGRYRAARARRGAVPGPESTPQGS